MQKQIRPYSVEFQHFCDEALTLFQTRHDQFRTSTSTVLGSLWHLVNFPNSVAELRCESVLEL